MVNGKYQIIFHYIWLRVSFFFFYAEFIPDPIQVDVVLPELIEFTRSVWGDHHTFPAAGVEGVSAEVCGSVRVECSGI